MREEREERERRERGGREREKREREERESVCNMSTSKEDEIIEGEVYFSESASACFY